MKAIKIFAVAAIFMGLGFVNSAQAQTQTPKPLETLIFANSADAETSSVLDDLKPLLQSDSHYRVAGSSTDPESLFVTLTCESVELDQRVKGYACAMQLSLDYPDMLTDNLNTVVVLGGTTKDAADMCYQSIQHSTTPDVLNAARTKIMNSLKDLQQYLNTHVLPNVQTTKEKKQTNTSKTTKGEI